MHYVNMFNNENGEENFMDIPLKISVKQPSSDILCEVVENLIDVNRLNY